MRFFIRGPGSPELLQSCHNCWQSDSKSTSSHWRSSAIGSVKTVERAMGVSKRDSNAWVLRIHSYIHINIALETTLKRVNSTPPHLCICLSPSGRISTSHIKNKGWPDNMSFPLCTTSLRTPTVLFVWSGLMRDEVYSVISKNFLLLWNLIFESKLIKMVFIRSSFFNNIMAEGGNKYPSNFELKQESSTWRNPNRLD